MADDQVQESPTCIPQPKKPFEPPRLEVYGDITALTRKIGNSGAPDGGVVPTNKTKL
jgi:hypothetical protein